MKDSSSLKLFCLNIHKGVSGFGVRDILSHLKSTIRETEADVVFLQEVLGAADLFPKQYEFLADSLWPNYAYYHNSEVDTYGHGNAILSKFELREIHKLNLKIEPYRRRGLLHCELKLEDGTQIHSICTHLGLRREERKKQFQMIERYLTTEVDSQDRVLLAGDFNDWNTEGKAFANRMGLEECYQSVHGDYAKTFPSSFPLLKLDRIYTRGFKAVSAATYGLRSRLSDHLGLCAEVSL